MREETLLPRSDVEPVLTECMSPKMWSRILPCTSEGRSRTVIRGCEGLSSGSVGESDILTSSTSRGGLGILPVLALIVRWPSVCPSGWMKSAREAIEGARRRGVDSGKDTSFRESLGCEEVNCGRGGAVMVVSSGIGSTTTGISLSILK